MRMELACLVCGKGRNLSNEKDFLIFIWRICQPWLGSTVSHSHIPQNQECHWCPWKFPSIMFSQEVFKDLFKRHHPKLNISTKNSLYFFLTRTRSPPVYCQVRLIISIPTTSLVTVIVVIILSSNYTRPSLPPSWEIQCLQLSLNLD